MKSNPAGAPFESLTALRKIEGLAEGGDGRGIF